VAPVRCQPSGVHGDEQDVQHAAIAHFDDPRNAGGSMPSAASEIAARPPSFSLPTGQAARAPTPKY
jgi:hypothetical protein